MINIFLFIKLKTLATRTKQGNSFDIKKFQAAGHGIKKLLSVAKREALLIEDRYVRMQPATLSNMKKDPIADRLLHRFHFQDSNETAITSTGDGDCLFNAVSQLLIAETK